MLSSACQWGTLFEAKLVRGDTNQGEGFSLVILFRGMFVFLRLNIAFF